ncbi:CDP-glucose 4,6-dehydratase [bacterium]|nr:CDP-glucose 4,6-dehydratase [bacterium]
MLVTGHTGFKGTWLTMWLSRLNAEVLGYSIGVPTSPSMFGLCETGNHCSDFIGDVRDLERFSKIADEFKPEVIFHLAAQPIVRESIREPITTFSTNAIGTASVIEYVRLSGRPIVLVLVTSDKVYQNQNWHWGYREIDNLSQQDPYSASKAMAETVVQSYLYTFPGAEFTRRLAIGRAGNVIGGGDFALNRIIPDVYRAISSGTPLRIRNPNSTRPWQHVLEPLSGYLSLAGNLLSEVPKVAGEAFNFGPASESAVSVQELLQTLGQAFPEDWPQVLIQEDVSSSEAQLLQLDWTKANLVLGWKPILSLGEALEWTTVWYKNILEAERGVALDQSLTDVTFTQIEEFMERLETQK